MATRLGVGSSFIQYRVSFSGGTRTADRPWTCIFLRCTSCLLPEFFSPLLRSFLQRSSTLPFQFYLQSAQRSCLSDRLSLHPSAGYDRLEDGHPEFSVALTLASFHEF